MFSLMGFMNLDIRSKWRFFEDMDGFGDPGWQIQYSPTLKGYCNPDTYGNYKYSWGVHDSVTGRSYAAHADTLEDGKTNADKLAFLYTLEKLLYGKHIVDWIESLN